MATWGVCACDFSCDLLRTRDRADERGARKVDPEVYLISSCTGLGLNKKKSK